MESNKELLFSVTSKHCRWDYYRGIGSGGQKRNKTSSAVRCTHIESGAVGKAEESRSQIENRRLAFTRMGESDKFQTWVKVKAAEIDGTIRKIKEQIDLELVDPNITKIEFWNGSKYEELKEY